MKVLKPIKQVYPSLHTMTGNNKDEYFKEALGVKNGALKKLKGSMIRSIVGYTIVLLVLLLLFTKTGINELIRVNHKYNEIDSIIKSLSGIGYWIIFARVSIISTIYGVIYSYLFSNTLKSYNDEKVEIEKDYNNWLVKFNKNE